MPSSNSPTPQNQSSKEAARLARSLEAQQRYTRIHNEKGTREALKNPPSHHFWRVYGNDGHVDTTYNQRNHTATKEEVYGRKMEERDEDERKGGKEGFLRRIVKKVNFVGGKEDEEGERKRKEGERMKGVEDKVVR